MNVERKKKSIGFSLIELMVVVAIIGILATIAVPTYNDYMIRSRVTELLTTFDSLKADITTTIIETGVVSGLDLLYPNFGTTKINPYNSTTNANTNLASGSISTTTGAVALVGTAAAGGVTLTFTPTLVSGTVTWACSSSPSSNWKYVPASCRH